ncbi:LysM peptidoglycan-binding domain-containing protein [Hymenobacter sp. BT175]|uniref:LysM peptidoglycan-binding domain-containing protein n=1 Tax=Hymenobacter translucens TaxID=2886507 RepID=UPI001D0ED297|nr:LysM peptidoglycan-binding domain-containing protein [Hymenobacter translucens]MCC2546394.1 LysM peptidoglycan-binding domain-containing protein [Hymenobacter translucens]
MNRFSFLFATLAFTSFSASAASFTVLPPDSIGVEYRGNKVLIKHKVAPGETLYGISRKYKVPVDQIVELNPKLAGALAAGQVVLVPRNRVVLNTPTPAPKTAAAPAAAPGATGNSTKGLTTDAQGNKVYKVEKGQSLFAVARRFGVTPDDLKELNRLPADGSLRLGQTLIIIPAPGTGKSPAAVAAAPAKVAPVAPASRPERDDEPDRPKEQPQPRETPREKEKEVIATVTPAPADKEKEAEAAPTRASEIVHRTTESGLAAVIEGNITDKYLALHKTAAVGTIMQVRNIMNGQSVYVRVIGPLPDTGENSNVLIRLSRRAVQKLASPDARFRVETSYVP